MSTANREEAEHARAAAVAARTFADWVAESVQRLNDIVSLTPKGEEWEAGAAHVIYRMLGGIAEEAEMKADLAESMARIKTEEHLNYGKDPDPVTGWYFQPGGGRRGVELTRVADESDLSWQNRRDALAAHQAPAAAMSDDDVVLLGGTRPIILAARRRAPVDPGQPHGA